MNISQKSMKALKSLMNSRFGSRWHGADDVTITWICDAKGTHSEVFTACCTELNVIPCVMMNTGLCQHSIVFNFTFPELWSVVGQDDEFSLALSQVLEGLFVSKVVLAALHNQLKASINTLHLLFLFL